METNIIYNEDCLEGLKKVPDKSVQLIICDLPYGTTDLEWDSIIPFEPLWEQYERIIEDNGAIVLFASGTFTNKVLNSNPSLYKYKWIWVKTKSTNFVNAKNKPMSAFEEVLVFSKGNTANGSKNKMLYNPQGLVKYNKIVSGGVITTQHVGHRPSHKDSFVQEYTNYPNDILYFPSESNVIHPTQKPVSLIAYLVKTYTNKEDIVVDNCMGSGTTAVACIQTGRKYIGYETDKVYYKKSMQRTKRENRKPKALF